MRHNVTLGKKGFSLLTCVALAFFFVGPGAGFSPAAACKAASARELECGAVIGPEESVKLAGDVGPCEGEAAITVIGPAVLNLNGHSVYGNKMNVGIKVEGEGAMVRNGTVTACSNAVVVVGEGGHRIRKLNVVENNRNGIVVDSNDNRIARNTIERNYDNGIHVYGDGNRIRWNSVNSNWDEGIEIDGNQNRVYHNTASGNKNDSIQIDGDENRVVGNTAANDQGEGIRIGGDSNIIRKNKAVGNAGEGIRVVGNNNRIEKNEVKDNGETGIHIWAGYVDNLIKKNIALNNGAGYPDLADENPGCEADKWIKNTFDTAGEICIE